MENNDLELTGKVVKFPRNTKAMRALQFLESIKVNPNKLWYIIIEDQEKDLKMVKYNRALGINLIEFTNMLKEYYIKFYVGNDVMLEQFNKIEVVGEEDFSVIKNIPQIVLENNQTLISKITKDLINLLAK